jgi:2,3-bisphosphoglycerate-independent phosphoglycerate mutase
MTNATKPKPITLIIFDGWGYSKQTDHNALAQANTPNFDHLWEGYPHTLLEGSGNYVGLPKGQMGNSEVGHLNLGAGRVVKQVLTRIQSAIETGQFDENAALKQAMEKAKANNKAVHILGLLSPGGVHSHEDQIFSAVKMASNIVGDNLYVHAMLDGRDTPPKSALPSIEKLETLLQTLGSGKIASLIGRYYAMDRDQRWDRIEMAYDLLTQGKATRQASTATEALQMAYDDDETDEFVTASSIHTDNEKPAIIEDGDVVIFMNYRADRARQITRAFIEKDFHGFNRERQPKLSEFVTLTEYDASFNVPVAFGPEILKNTLGEYLAKNHCRQLRIAETEKYAHVTFFFNGGVEKPFEGEARDLIASPKVATYDLQPEMSARELTEKLTKAIRSQDYDVIICNYANADMVGHTGDFDATLKAIDCLDKCLGQVWQASKDVGGELLITADHGNAEKMFNEETEQAHTAHTSNPVPLIYAGRKADFTEKPGSLADVAPTLLYLLGLDIPEEMTGEVLLALN